MSDPDLQDRLENLAKIYRVRQEQWDIAIAHADRARGKHRQIADASARQRADIESIRRGADFLHKQIDGGSIFKPTRLLPNAESRTAKSASATLNAHYQNLDDLQAAQKVTAASIVPSGPAGARNVPLVGGKFWEQYRDQVEKGNYRAAELMLKSRESVAKPLRWLTGGSRSVQAWNAHAAQARQLAEAHQNRHVAVDAANRAVAKSEKRVARSIEGLLKNNDVKALLASNHTRNTLDRNIDMLRDLHLSGRTDGKAIRAYLQANRGNVDLDSVANSFHSLHHKLAIDVRRARQDASITQKRHQAVAELANSCRTARHYETMGSLVDGRFSRNFAAELERLSKADLSDPAVRAEAERAADIAFIKGGRWMTPEQGDALKRDIAMAGQPGLDPDALQTLPHHHYRRHAVRDSTRRAGEAFRTAAQTTATATATAAGATIDSARGVFSEAAKAGGQFCRDFTSHQYSKMRAAAAEMFSGRTVSKAPGAEQQKLLQAPRQPATIDMNIT